MMNGIKEINIDIGTQVQEILIGMGIGQDVPVDIYGTGIYTNLDRQLIAMIELHGKKNIKVITHTIHMKKVYGERVGQNPLLIILTGVLCF